MDADHINSELEALQRLYKFLQNDGYGVSKTSPDTLDDKTRVVLKNLLDMGTRKALKVHAEMMIAKLASLCSVSPSQMLQPQESAKEQPVPQENFGTESDDSESFVTASEVSESFGMDPGSDQRKNPEQSIIQNVDTSAPEYLTKHCRLCKKSSIKKLDSISSENQRKIDMETKPDTDFGGINNCGDEIPNKPKDINCLSDEASETIKEIELCLSNLQLGADYHNLFEKRSFPHEEAVTGTSLSNPCPWTQPDSLLHVESSQSNFPRDQVTCEVVSEEICFPYDTLSSFNLARHRNGTLHLTTQQYTRNVAQTCGSSLPDEIRESTEERDTEYQNTGHMVKAMVDRTASRKWKTNGNNFTPLETPNAENLISVPFEMGNFDNSPIAAINNKRKGNEIFPQHKHSKSSVMKWMSNEHFPDWRPRGTNRSPSVSREVTVRNKNKKYGTESAAYSSSYSSNTSSQQYSSDSDENSLPRRTHRLRSVTPTSTNSEASPLTSETDSKYSSSTRNGEDEVYSSTSNSSREVTSSTGSKTKDYAPVKVTHRAKKQSGTWKSLKDRLGIIFHHHLYHHHHHKKEKGHYKVKSFFPRRKAEAYGEKAVDEMMKSVVHDKKQQTHFRGIMEAVLRHMRHSKKVKSGDKKVPLDKVKHGNTKLSQKLQWWKVLQQHRRRKLPSKVRVKIGAGTMKPRLKALPTIK